MSVTKVTDILPPQGTHAARPAATAVAAGTKYSCSDHNLIYHSDGAVWTTWANASGVDAEAVRDAIGAALVAGTGATITVNDAGDTITIAVDTTSEAERIRDVIGTALVAGSGVTLTVNDAGDTITVASSAGLDAEGVRDTIGAALVAGSGITITVDDSGDTITITASGGLDAEGVRDTIGAALVAGTGITITVNDAGDTITITATGAGVTYPFTRTYSSDIANGIIAWLATAGGTKTFSNPATSGSGDVPDPFVAATVTVSQSSNQDGTRVANKALDHSLDASTGCSHTTNSAGGWWKIDFGASHTVAPTKVSLIGRSSGGTHPRNWKLQGSNDDSAWTDLLTVTGAGPNDSTWYSATVTGAAAYRYLRILSTGVDSAGSNYLIIGDIEFWGVVT